MTTADRTGTALGSAPPTAAAGGPGESGRKAGIVDRLRALGPLAWLGPSLVLILGVVLYPVVALVVSSTHAFNDFGFDLGFTGLGNYRRLLGENDLGHVVVNTVLWVVTVVGITVLVSLALAQFLNARFAGRRLVRWALIVPWAASLVMTSIVWRYMYDYYFGYFNRVLLDVGIIGKPIAWSQNPTTALWALVGVGIIVSIPFTTYVFLAGLQSIPDDVYEAARIDGSGAWQTYRRVTLPLLRPALIVAVVLNTIYVFNSFPIIWVITGNNPGYETDTTITYMYKLAFKTNLNIGEAAAMSLLNVAFILVLVVAYLRVIRWNDQGEGAVAAVGRSGRGRLGAPLRAVRLRARDTSDTAMRWVSAHVSAPLAPVGRGVRAGWTPARRFVMPFVGLLVAAFFLAPYVVMFLASVKSDSDLFASPAHYLPQHWHWSNWSKAFHYAPLGTFFKVSLLISVIGTVIVLLVSIPAAYYTARHRFRGRSAFLYLVLVTQMFAPVALVVGIYREWVQVDLSNSLVALVLTDSAFNLAFSIWILNGYFASIPKDIEEAAMLDGLSRFQAMRRVILPLAMPGVVTAVIFTFIAIWNEFVVALTIISSRSKEPLTVGIQSFIGQYQTQYQYLFVASLIAIVPVVVLFALIERYLVRGLTAGSIK